jgi:hypothetical protein
VSIGQLVSLKHCTQPPNAVSQCGAAGVQLASLVHAVVHCAPPTLQTDIAVGHWLLVVQP